MRRSSRAARLSRFDLQCPSLPSLSTLANSSCFSLQQMLATQLDHHPKNPRAPIHTAKDAFLKEAVAAGVESLASTLK